MGTAANDKSGKLPNRKPSYISDIVAESPHPTDAEARMSHDESGAMYIGVGPQGQPGSYRIPVNDRGQDRVQWYKNN